jgi:hypothetical protein
MSLACLLLAVAVAIIADAIAIAAKAIAIAAEAIAVSVKSCYWELVQCRLVHDARSEQARKCDGCDVDHASAR